MIHQEENEKWMRRCIELAKNGKMGAAPNPMVGAVIVYNDRIIGEGYHVCCGKAHAEVNAINSVSPVDRQFLKDSTIYVSLEPCAHYGRTPPCAEQIVRTGIPRVVIGCKDPFAKVSGRGIEILRNAGIDVTVGVLESECMALNCKFMVSQTLQRPFITLKWASSADGFMGSWEPGSVALSTPHTLMRVHHLRALHQAILVGHNTLISDRPSLTVRHWNGCDPLRIVLGRVAEGELPHGFEAFADIDTLMVSLHRRGIQSLLVEGGQQTLQSFIDRGLWDEAYEELSNVILGSGVPVPKMPVGVLKATETFFDTSISHWWNTGEGDEDWEEDAEARANE